MDCARAWRWRGLHLIAALQLLEMLKRLRCLPEPTCDVGPPHSMSTTAYAVFGAVAKRRGTSKTRYGSRALSRRSSGSCGCKAVR